MNACKIEAASMRCQLGNRLTVLLVACLTTLAFGCDEPVVVGERGIRPPGGARPAAGATADAGVDAAAETTVSYNDDSFVELDTTNRDPFRSFLTTFRTRTAFTPQRNVVMPNVAIDEMRLVGILTGIAQPEALLIDPAGVGYRVRRGEFIGRPEIFQSGGAESMAVTLNWQVARVRAGELVLTREDPSAPDRPPLSRVIPLYAEGEDPLELRRLAIERDRAAREAEGQGGTPVTGTTPGATPQ